VDFRRTPDQKPAISGPEVILLEGQEIVYPSAHDANRIFIGELWRLSSFADLKDHAIKNCLERIADETEGAIEVPYNKRGQFVSR
jgi:hypothetical protein